MKTNIKLLSTVLSVLLLAAMFGGCTQAPAAEPTAAPTATVEATPEATPEATAATESKLDKIKAAGKIVWGTNAEFSPFEMKDSDGTVIGVDADIAAKIADSLGVELVVEDMLFDSLPAALASGQIDFIGAGYTKNEERAQKMDFSAEYYTAVQVVAYNTAGFTPASQADLEGKKVGVQTGTTGDLFIASEIDGATVERYDNLMLALQDLQNGNLDAVIGDNLPVGMIIKNLDGLAVADSVVYDPEMYALAVDKGETELLDAINEVLQKLIDDGEIDAMVNKYSAG